MMVLTTIGLNDQSGLQANEIDDIRFDSDLTPELTPLE